MPQQEKAIIPPAGSKMAKYKTSLCKHFEQTQTCQMEDRCHFAHGKHELRKQTDVSINIIYPLLATSSLSCSFIPNTCKHSCPSRLCSKQI